MSLYAISLGRNQRDIRVYIRRQLRPKATPNSILTRDENIISTVATTLMFYEQHFPKRQVQEWVIHQFNVRKGNANRSFMTLTRVPNVLKNHPDYPRMTFEQGLEAFLEYMKMFVTSQSEVSDSKEKQ